MKLRILVALIGLLAAQPCAHAGSTIDPTQPAKSGALSSAPVRANFTNAYNDINSILGQYAGSAAPINPVVGQYWRQTNVTPNVVYQWTGGVWTQVATFDTVGNAVTPYFGSKLLAWQELIPGLGIAGQCLVFNGASALPTARSCINSSDLLAMPPVAASVVGSVATLSLNIDSNFAVSGGNLALNSVPAGNMLCNPGGSGAEPGPCSWNQLASQAIGTVNNSFPIYASGIWNSKTLGTSVTDPGTGTIEALVPPATPTISGNAITLGQSALFTEQRLSNGGTAFTVTLPASTVAGMSNGTPIEINNIDASATATLTAGSGTQICTATCGSTAAIGPGRATRWILDTTGATPSWRPTMNSLSALLSANGVAHQWVNSVTNGVAALSQPGFSDLSGSLAPNQCPAATASALGCIEGDGATLSLAAGVLSLNLSHSNSWASGFTQTFAGTANFTGLFQVGGNAMTFPGSAATLAALGLNQTFTGNDTFSGSTALSGGGSLGGTFSGSPTYSGAATYTGLSSGPCSSALVLNASNVLSLGACAGAATSIQAGSGGTTLTGSASSGYAITNNGGTTYNNQLFSAAGGEINRFRNGTFDIWNRGTSSLSSSTTGAYTADGWRVKQTGAAFTCSQDTGNNGPRFSLKCVGGTSNTDTVIGQRIESYLASVLAGATVTVQFQYKQNTGSAVTPKISSCSASATDNFATCNADLASTSLTSCASGSWCTEAYTFTASANAGNGYEVDLDCNTALSSSQDCWITAADIRVTPGVATGITANPPPPELRSIVYETLLCQRYLPSFLGAGSGSVMAMGGGISSTSSYGLFTFAIPARVAPTAIVVNSASNFLVTEPGAGTSTPTAMSFNTASATAGQVLFTTSGTGYSAGLALLFGAQNSSAILNFTGAEL